MPAIPQWCMRCSPVATRRVRYVLAPVVVWLALFAFSKPLYADTITIIDGPNTSPSGSTYTDGYINARLGTGSLTLEALEPGDDILVEPDVEIIWNTGNTFTLIADHDIVIRGTIQHNGPLNGSGGVQLVADNDANNDGDVLIGDPSQPDAVAVGSRYGQTSVQAHNVVLQAGGGANDNYTQLGFRVISDNPTTATGSIVVIATGSISGIAGPTHQSYVQVGNGGIFAKGNFSGDHTLISGGDIFFNAGTGNTTYAQVGNGGATAGGEHSGSHTLVSEGDITFQGGAFTAYAQVGNGGYNSAGTYSGSHTLDSGGRIVFEGGSWSRAYAQVGNGGLFSPGNHSGYHTLTSGGNIFFKGGTASYTYAQVGNGGASIEGDHSGDHSLSSGGDIFFKGGTANYTYAQVGNGGYSAQGDHNGSHTLTSDGDIIFEAGGAQYAYAQVGNGGASIEGTLNGSVTISATHTISFSASSGDRAYAQAGNGGYGSYTEVGSFAGSITISAAHTIFSAGNGDYAYAQAGNGGYGSVGDFTGSVTINATQTSSFSAGSEDDAYAQAGHGGVDAEGTREGDILLLAGEDVDLKGAQIGHTTTNGPINAGNTFIAISQNNPFPPGSGTLTANSSRFNSAPNGQLRFYVPRQANVVIDNGTPMNSEAYPGSVQADHMAGFYLFADNPAAHPYMEEYSFYLAPSMVYFAPTAYTVAENAGSVVLTLHLSPTNELTDTIVSFAINGGTATEGADYTPPSQGNVTIASGDNTASIVVPILNDLLAEPDETFTVLLTSATNGVVGSNSQATVTIQSDDLPPALTVSKVASVDSARVGETIIYTYRITNTGGLTFTAITATDDRLGPITLNGSSLGLGEVATGQASYTVQLTDLPGPLVNTVSVTATPVEGENLVVSETASVALVDDLLRALEVSKVASVEVASVGETIIYTYRITNSGDVPFTTITAIDDKLGAITLDRSSLGIGDVATGQLSYTVQATDLPGPLVNTVTVQGTPVVGENVVATASTSVDLVELVEEANFTLSKTVGIQGYLPECTTNSTIKVPVNTTVVYCFTITNTGDVPLTTHTLHDDHLGTLLDNMAVTVAPGQSYAITATATLDASVTNTAIWTADGVSRTAQATVTISSDDDDQDGDGIPDNEEDAGDSDGDGIPDFLDPDDDTPVDPEEPQQESTLFLPTVTRE